MVRLNNTTNDDKSYKKIELENDINIEILKNKIKKLCNHNKCIRINNFYYPFPVYECKKCSSNFLVNKNKVYALSNIGFFNY